MNTRRDLCDALSQTPPPAEPRAGRFTCWHELIAALSHRCLPIDDVDVASQRRSEASTGSVHGVFRPTIGSAARRAPRLADLVGQAAAVLVVIAFLVLGAWAGDQQPTPIAAPAPTATNTAEMRSATRRPVSMSDPSLVGIVDPSPVPASTVKVSVTVRSQSGGVTSTDGRIDCPEACTADYTFDEQVRLVAAKPGFIRWTGCPQTDGLTCTITAWSALTVTATYHR